MEHDKDIETREETAQPVADADTTPEERGAKPPKPAPEDNAITRFYAKLPFSFKQVDIFVKIAIGALVLILVYGYLTGSYSPLK